MFDLQEDIHYLAKERGFWSGDIIDGVHLLEVKQIALIGSEVSECLEAHRNGRIFGVNSVEEELADIVIRAMDLAEHFHIILADAVRRKHEANRSRAFLHNKRY